MSAENIIDNNGRMESLFPTNLKRAATKIWKRGGVWKLNGLPSAPKVANHCPCRAYTPSSQSVSPMFLRLMTLSTINKRTIK